MYFIGSTPNFQTRGSWLSSTCLRAVLAAVRKHTRVVGGGSNLLLALRLAASEVCNHCGILRLSRRVAQRSGRYGHAGPRSSKVSVPAGIVAPASPARRHWELASMDEDRFNISVRKFLKVVGVTSQREIEKAVHEAIQAGRLRGDERLQTKVTLTIEAVGLAHVVEDGIELG
jgi:hypothetical protein